MRTFGGRRALTHVCAFVALCVPAALLTGCSAAVDLSHSVQTKLGRVDGIAEASVATPSQDTGAAIAVTYTSADTSRELADLLEEIEKVTDEAEYPSYRLDLTPVDSNGDRLTVDDTFVDSDDRTTVLDNWFSVTSALLGPVQYTYEPGSESISVDSEAGIAHDIGEASRLHYGSASTTWTFVNGPTSFVASGRVTPSDITMFGAVQRSVASDVLPAPAGGWRLERWAKQVVLDLDVTFPDAPIPPDRLTVDHYGRDVHPLFDAAVAATREAGLPVRMELRNPTDTDPDVFGYWTSDAKPQRGRDPLSRGWDLWLVTAANA